MDATRVVLRSGPEHSIAEALLAIRSLAGMTRADLDERAEKGEIIDADGRPVELDAPSRPDRSLYLYRDVADEPEVPFELTVLHRDERIVVVDKPHFLATMPRGRHVRQTALVRLRRLLGDDAVAPAHRIDRLTAGVLLFTVDPAVRSAYQELFATRTVTKEYRALAPYRPDLRRPTRVADRIEKTAGDLRARVEPGPVNAVSVVELLREVSGGLAEYRLSPETGRTHQLRLHLAGLGAGIVDDPLYPEIRPELAELPDRGDFGRPLRLVAHRLAFRDPVTGEHREFVSERDVTVDPPRLA